MRSRPPARCGFPRTGGASRGFGSTPPAGTRGESVAPHPVSCEKSPGRRQPHRSPSGVWASGPAPGCARLPRRGGPTTARLFAGNARCLGVSLILPPPFPVRAPWRCAPGYPFRGRDTDFGPNLRDCRFLVCVCRPLPYRCQNTAKLVIAQDRMSAVFLAISVAYAIISPIPSGVVKLALR